MCVGDGDGEWRELCCATCGEGVGQRRLKFKFRGKRGKKGEGGSGKVERAMGGRRVGDGVGASAHDA